MRRSEEEVLADIERTMRRPSPSPSDAEVMEASTLYRACLRRNAPRGSVYLEQMDSVIEPDCIPTVEQLRGIVAALRTDIKDKSPLLDFEASVHATVFSDLLQQAEYLLKENLLLPAAVVVGATLEEHVRKLAFRFSVPLDSPDPKTATMKPKPISRLNTELRAANAYTLPEEREVQAWYDIRTEAAHNKPQFASRTASHVDLMLRGVRDFIIRNPA